MVVPTTTWESGVERFAAGGRERGGAREGGWGDTHRHPSLMTTQHTLVAPPPHTHTHSAPNFLP